MLKAKNALEKKREKHPGRNSSSGALRVRLGDWILCVSDRPLKLLRARE